MNFAFPPQAGLLHGHAAWSLEGNPSGFWGPTRYERS